MGRTFKLAFALIAVLSLCGYYGGGYTGGEGGNNNTPAATTTLTAVVGPGQTITLKKGTTTVKSLKKGTYKIVVDDKSTVHNFHLTGPGVNRMTTIAERVKRTWNVTLKVGTYNFVCDPHSSFMKGNFKVTS